MKPIVKVIATSMVVLAALGVIAYKYIDYMKYPWTRDGLVRARLFRLCRAYPVSSFACRSRIINW